MSLAILKKKAATKYSKNMAEPRLGFSLQGTHRNIGVVNPTNLAKTSTNTKYKGDLPKGNGGCCGTYDKVISKGACCVPQTTVKPSNKSMQTMIQSRNRWLNSTYPKSSVKNLTPDDQTTRIYKKRLAQTCADTSTNYAANQTVCSEPNCVASYTKGPFHSNSSSNYTDNKGISKKVCLPFRNRDLVLKCRRN